MSGVDALLRLEAAGVTFELRDDGMVAFEYPASLAARAAPLIEQIRAHRQEAVTLLRRRRVAVLPAGRLAPDSSACYACTGKNFWISKSGIRICEVCHPPAIAALVARRETFPQEGASK